MNNDKEALLVAYTSYINDKKGDNIFYISEKNDRVCVMIEEDCIKIGGTGSNDFKDWFQNTLILGTNVPGIGRVPRGFYKNIEKLVDKIAFHILLHKEKVIDGSGHSRGAVIISYVLYRLWEKGFNIRSLTGFGCPNFVKSTGKDQFNGIIPTIKMFRNGGDQVTRHPVFGYKKPVKQIQIGPKRNWFTKRFNKDHLIERYMANL